MNYKIFVSDDRDRIHGRIRGVIATEKAPGGYIFTFKFLAEACEAMTTFRNSGYREVIALWH